MKSIKFIRNFIIKILASTLVFICINNAKAECWNEAATSYGHDPYILKAIGWKESRGHVGAVGSLLKDGNRALGLMQINTIHLPELQKHGITRNDLFDACISQKVAAWVLADCLKKKGDIWTAVGCYYGGSASKAYTAMRKYSQDVRRYYEAYKRNAGLPTNYTPMYKNPNLDGEIISTKSVNNNFVVPQIAQVSQSIQESSSQKKTEQPLTGLQIIRF